MVAGGTFLGILVNQRSARALVPAQPRATCRASTRSRRSDGDLRLGAMVRHRAVERSAEVREGWPALAEAFSVVASPRVRNQATVGGVLADADYASDPPAMLCALGARAVVPKRARRAVELPVEELITGYYETALAPDELIVERRVPRADGAPSTASFARARTRTGRACRSQRSASAGELRVVVGAVAGPPQTFPELCARVGQPLGARSRPRSATATRRRSTRSPTCAARPPTAGASSRSRCGAPSRSWAASDPDR